MSLTTIRLTAAVFAVLAVGIAAQHASARIVIDEFGTPTIAAVIDAPPFMTFLNDGPELNGYANAPAWAPIERTTTLTRLSGTSTISAISNAAASDFPVSMGFGSSGIVSLYYSGAGNTPLNYELTEGGLNTGVRIKFSIKDVASAGTTIKATLVDGANTYIQTQTIDPALNYVFYKFNQFTNLSNVVTPITAANTIDSLRFEISTTQAGNFNIDFIDAGIPEPASGAMLGLGLVGWMIRRRKLRRAKAALAAA